MKKKYILDNFIDFIDSSDNFVISGHENPDPDSISSMISLEYLMFKLNKNVVCLNSDPTPINLLTLDYRDVVKCIDDYEFTNFFKEFNLIIVDSNDINNIGKIASTILPKSKKFFFIDHHSQKFEKLDDALIDVSASSTCEIIYELYDYFKIDIPKEIGDALYSGILFDSGSFHYPKTSSVTLQIASEIVSKGVDPNEIYLLLFEQESVESLKIASYVMATLELFHNDQIAALTMTKSSLKKSGARYEDAGQLINFPLKSFNVKSVVFFKENLKGVKKVSLRSKGDLDVSEIAQIYEGGGHKNSSGFKIKYPFKKFSDVKEVIINQLIKKIDDCIF